MSGAAQLVTSGPLILAARAATSASMITAPWAASRRDTSLLPDPIPPVSPARSTRCPVTGTSVGNG